MKKPKESGLLLENGKKVCAECLDPNDQIYSQLKPGDTYSTDPCDRCNATTSTWSAVTTEKVDTVSLGVRTCHVIRLTVEALTLDEMRAARTSAKAKGWIYRGIYRNQMEFYRRI